MYKHNDIVKSKYLHLRDVMQIVGITTFSYYLVDANGTTHLCPKKSIKRMATKKEAEEYKRLRIANSI